ncbi:hypothetical protein [Pandoraea fibrosis]|nr:hypothetical protein [Pandoraea fibrosis]
MRQTAALWTAIHTRPPEEVHRIMRTPIGFVWCRLKPDSPAPIVP